ncbi:MAG: ABC transporter ATP-binding protein [Proteobacteria bacterium]|nr:ABC transporter ATP-binding protein [Pseudomonadota bacterium]
MEISEGEFATLVGPSGCGKTTTMRMIAGLDDPSEGDILFGDRLVNDVSIQKRNVAMVFQNYALYPHLRVADNLQYGLKKRGIPRADREEKVAWVADLLRINSLLDRKPRELSGGEQQRVALGRAIIRTPDVLLLDEPLSNLDAKLRTMMRVELVNLQRKIGCTTIFVTHDQLEAMTMSDRIAVMNNGQIQQFAPPATVYDRPANLFVAGFIGSPPMNLIEGELSGDGDDVVFSAPAMSLRLTRGDLGGIPAGSDRKVTLGIRPENITINRASICDTTAKVGFVEFIGAEKYVFLESPVGLMIARESADSDTRAQEDVNVVLHKSKIRLFSSSSGLSLQC